MDREIAASCREVGWDGDERRRVTGGWVKCGIGVRWSLDETGTLGETGILGETGWVVEELG